MSWEVRYWLFAALTWIAVRVVTGSPLLATFATSAMCWTLSEDRRADRLKIKLTEDPQLNTRTHE